MSPPAEAGDGGLARTYAQVLLAAFGIGGAVTPDGLHPALAWRRSGLMAVTGRSDGPARVVPAALTAAADGALAALRALASSARLPNHGWALPGERARLLGLGRHGSVSANETCHLLAANDGILALNLARPDDWTLLPALFRTSSVDRSAIGALVAEQPVADLVARGRELGLPISSAAAVPRAPAIPIQVKQFAEPRASTARPLVVDLSSLWAGPLAGALLALAGADVIKVESKHRPDGARGGNGAFFDLLNAGKRSVVLDFGDPQDLVLLRTLLSRADIVIEGSRPRALAQLGIDAQTVAQGGASWLSITAYGREGDAAHWVGFGDDVAVAGGLATAMSEGWGEVLFAGDAIADPLTGMVAALAGLASWRTGGGRLVSVPMVSVIGHALALYRPEADERAQWQVMAEADDQPLVPLRAAPGRARPAGADTAWAGATFAST